MSSSGNILLLQFSNFRAISEQFQSSSRAVSAIDWSIDIFVRIFGFFQFSFHEIIIHEIQLPIQRKFLIFKLRVRINLY